MEGESMSETYQEFWLDHSEYYPKETADKCWLVLHTQPVDDNGTDLPKVISDLAPNIKYVFTH
jgi:hypothetical protein